MKTLPLYILQKSDGFVKKEKPSAKASGTENASRQRRANSNPLDTEERYGMIDK